MENIELRKLLMKIGIYSNIKGFHYILEAVNIIKNQGTHISMMNVYKMIHEKYNNTPSAIERAMRHAIGKAYNENDVLKNIYSNVPDNSAFLYDLVFNFDIFKKYTKTNKIVFKKIFQ